MSIISRLHGSAVAVGGASTVSLAQGQENAAANVAALQSALDAGGYVAITTPGEYWFSGTQTSSGVKALSDYAICWLRDDTYLYTAPGVILKTPPKGSGILAKPLFCNDAVNSNALSITGGSIVPGNITNRIHVVTLNIPGHTYAVGDTIQIRGDMQPNIYSTLTGSIAGTTLTVTAQSGRPLYVGAKIEAADGSAAVTEATFITAFGTGSGGIGTYTVNNSQTVASQSLIGKRSQSLNGFYKVKSAVAGVSVTIHTYELNTPGIPISASFTATIAGQLLTITATTGTAPQVGMILSGTGITPGTTITKALVVNADGTGTYNVSFDQTLTSRVFTARPVVYRANSSIILDIQGEIDGGSNTDCVTVPFQALGYIGIQISKIASFYIKEINSVGWQTIAMVTQYDKFQVDKTSFQLGAVGYFVGAGNHAILSSMSQQGGEESYYVFTSESPLGPHFVSDQDNRMSLFGNIGLVELKSVYTFGYTYCAVRINVADGWRIESVVTTGVSVDAPVQKASVVQVENVWNIGGDIGSLVFRDMNIDPTGGSVLAINPYSKYINIDSLLFENTNVLKRGRNVGLVDAKVIDASGTSGSTIGKIGFVDCTFNFDCNLSTTTIPAINLPFAAYNVALFTMDRVKLVGNGNAQALFAVNTPALVSTFTDVTISGGADGGHILNATPAHTSGKKAIFTRCRSVDALTSLYMALIQQNFTVELSGCVVDWFGNLVQIQGSGFTVNATFGACTVPNNGTYLLNGAAGVTYNIRSMGANICGSSTHLNSAAGTFNLIGNCADLSVNLNQISRAGSGGALAKSGVSAGTIVVGNLAVCDMTNAAGSWKQLSNTTLNF